MGRATKADRPLFSGFLSQLRMASLSSEERKRGVICSSAGNHAQGVALSAARLGCEATICMPLITPDIKVEAVKKLGGDVVLVGENYDECQAYAIKTAQERGLSYIHPFDDPYVIAGQGTVGVEILRQVSRSNCQPASGIPNISLSLSLLAQKTRQNHWMMTK